MQRCRQDVDHDQVGEQETRARWEECSSLESQKHLSTLARRPNPTSLNRQQRDWPTFLAGVAGPGIVVAGSVALGREKILE